MRFKEELVMFILSSQNVENLSWGTRLITFGDQKFIELPVLIIRMYVEVDL